MGRGAALSITEIATASSATLATAPFSWESVPVLLNDGPSTSTSFFWQPEEFKLAVSPGCVDCRFTEWSRRVSAARSPVVLAQQWALGDVEQHPVEPQQEVGTGCFGAASKQWQANCGTPASKVEVAVAATTNDRKSLRNWLMCAPSRIIRPILLSVKRD